MVTMPNQNPQLDPDAVRMAKAIRKIESNDNFTARGKTGEFGAYQFMPETWKGWSKQYLGRDVPLERATPEEQNEVAYKRIKEWKDKGFNLGQVASSWNAGEGRKDAYATGFRGVNSKGVSFDTGDYAKKVATAYQQLKAQGPQVGGNYPAPPQVKPFQAAGGGPEKQKSLGRKVAEFLLPVLEEKERTPLQWAGDIGLSALTVLPGLGLAGKGLQAAGLVAKTAKGVGAAAKGASLLNTAGKGAAIGYGADVASDLSRGETDLGAIVTPGLGTAVGGIGGAAVHGLGKAVTPILSRTSGVPQGALQHSAVHADKVKGLIKAGTSPKATHEVAVGAVKQLRKDMSSGWEKGVQKIVDKYEPRRVGLPEAVGNDLRDIASRYNTATKTRIRIPQNPQNLSAKELTEVIKDINGVKYNPAMPDRALMDMKAYLKELGKKSFNDGGEFTELYSNYATKSEILDAADDIVKAFKSKKPINLTSNINRLQTIFNDGKDEYLQAIQALERETGVDILSHVAANKTMPKMPLDLRPGIQLDDILQWLGVLVTSPRAAAELNRILTGASTSKVGSFLTGAAKVAPVVPGLLER